MARVTKVARLKIFFARSIHCCPNFFPDWSSYFVKNAVITSK
jgi:hypothetical protein